MDGIVSKRNLVVNSDLNVTYDIEAQTYTKEDGETKGTWYRVTRHATKSYTAVNLTYAGAKKAEAEAVAAYTRAYSVLGARAANADRPEELSVPQLTSSVNVRQVGPAWELDVDIDETDVKSSATLPADPATLFATENARYYGEIVPSASESGEYIAITGAELGHFTAADSGLAHDVYDVRLLIDTNIGWDKHSDFLIQIKSSATATTWTNMAALKGGGDDLYGLPVNDPSGKFVRIVYDDIESNTFQLPNEFIH